MPRAEITIPKTRVLGIVRRVPKRLPAARADRGRQRPQVTDGGGYLIKRAKVVLIFWGKKWKQGTTPSMSRALAAIKSILASPYLSKLAQYRGIRPATLLATHLVGNSSPPNPFSDDDIARVIFDQIMGGNVPNPAQDGSPSDIIYLVIVPPGVNSSDHSDAVGLHFKFSSFLPPLDTVYCGWITNDGTLDGGFSIPSVLSHELAETCSDPDLDGGILLNDGIDEISDVCEEPDNPVVIDGVARQPYFSAHDGRCVTPDSYSVRWFFSVAGKDPRHGLRAAVPLPFASISLKELLYEIVP